MGLMDTIFGRPQQQAPKQESMAQQNPGASHQVTKQLPDNASLPTDKESSPLDAFKEIWQPNDPKNTPADPLAAPILTHDPQKLQQAVAGMNFTQGLTAEQVQKAMQDPAEFLKVINSTAQRAFAAAAELSVNTTEHAVKANNQRYDQTLTTKVRDANLQSTRSQNPILNHEAVSPVLETMRRGIAAKNPSMPAHEVQARAEEMFGTMSEQFMNNKQRSAQPSNQSDPYDFSSWG